VDQKLLIDTNVLVLLIVGYTNPAEIYNHRRLRQYNDECWKALSEFVDNYQELWVTSHVVAETSNLLKSNNPTLTKQCRLKFSKFLCQENVRESQLSAKLIITGFQNTVIRLGVPDSALIQKSKRVDNLITDDFDLYAAVVKNGFAATKFEHLLCEKSLL